MVPDSILFERFWKKVNKTDTCWVWIGAKAGRMRNGSGIRGHMFIGNKQTEYVHRISWRIHFGKIPEGMSVLHECDNSLCVRPDHLFLGTQTDNIADMDAKGRRVSLIGERHGRAVIDESKVREIRKAAASGSSRAEIARRTGIAHWIVRDVISRKNWKHVS